MNSVKGKWCPLKSWKHERLRTHSLSVCVCPRPAWCSPRKAEMMAAWSSHPGCQRKCPHPTNEKRKDHQKWSVRLCHENKALTWRDDSKLWVWWRVFVFSPALAAVFSSLGDGARQIWLFVFVCVLWFAAMFDLGHKEQEQGMPSVHHSSQMPVYQQCLNLCFF